MSRSFHRLAIESNNDLNHESCSNTILQRKGTKPWIDGLTLTSTGLKEFDRICGGGQVLGSSIILEEDRWTQDLALSLTKYWISEAVSQKQRVLFIATDYESSNLELPSCLNTNFIQTLPTDLSTNIPHQGVRPSTYRYFYQLLPLRREMVKMSIKSPTIQTSSLSVFDTIDEELVLKKDREETYKYKQKSSDDFLLNAWQYKKSIQRERSGIPMSFKRSSFTSPQELFCHSYDLSYKSLFYLDEKSIILGHCRSCPIHACQQSKSCSFFLFQRCIDRIIQECKLHPNNVIRVLLLNPPLSKASLALPLLVSYVRNRSLPVVFLVTTRPWLASSLKDIFSLRRSCDSSFKCDSFASLEEPPPSEFDHLDGIFTVQRMALQTNNHFSNVSTKHPLTTNRYGIRRDRRKVFLQLLHLPAQKDVAGNNMNMACMTNLTKENRNLCQSIGSLDF